jgi:exodeoxyribonuclease-3
MPDNARILVWDLARPGKARVQRVLGWLFERRFELVVLAKCRASSVPLLVDALEGAGYSVLLGGASFQPSLVVASLEGAEPNSAPSPGGYEHRWIPFSLPWTSGLAVHIPYAGEHEGPEGKRRYWDEVLQWSREHRHECAMILGVFNTGLPADTQGERYSLGQYMQDLLDEGWVDCWRQANPGVNDFGWFSHTGNGFRLDHCFFSPSLAARLQDSEFDHQARFDRLAASAPLVVRVRR